MNIQEKKLVYSANYEKLLNRWGELEPEKAVKKETVNDFLFMIKQCGAESVSVKGEEQRWTLYNYLIELIQQNGWVINQQIGNTRHTSHHMYATISAESLPEQKRVTAESRLGSILLAYLNAIDPIFEWIMR
jgi:hypothetical protein